MKKTILFLCLCLLMSCATTNVIMLQDNYVATPSTNSPEILYNFPSGEYTQIAKITYDDEVWGSATNEKENIQKIKTKAKELGADAVIILGTNKTWDTGSNTYSNGYGYLYTVQNPQVNSGIQAIAIKYK